MFIKSFLQDIKSCVFGISIIGNLPLDQAASRRVAVLQQGVLMDNLFYQGCVGLGTWRVLRMPMAILTVLPTGFMSRRSESGACCLAAFSVCPPLGNIIS